MYQHSVSRNHPRTNISHFKIIDQDSKLIAREAREAREAIHLRISSPALNCNTGKMYILEIFNNLLAADRSTNESNQMVSSNHVQGHTHLTGQSNRFTRAVCLAIK